MGRRRCATNTINFLTNYCKFSGCHWSLEMTGGFWCFYLQNVPNQYQPSTWAWRGETGKPSMRRRKCVTFTSAAIREESKIHVAGNASLARTSHTQVLPGPMGGSSVCWGLGGRFWFQVLVWTKHGRCSGSSPCYQNSPEQGTEPPGCSHRMNWPKNEKVLNLHHWQETICEAREGRWIPGSLQ